MVRKITIQGSVDFAGPEVIFDILFGNDEFIKSYHKKINCDPHAEASSWNQNNEREVKYMALSEGPKMITNIVGESFPVKELQKYVKKGSCYTITCDPTVISPTGDHFLTHAETTLSPHDSGGCAVVSNVTLECKGMWGLKGAIESFMDSKARTGFEQWLAFAKAFCREKLSRAGAEEMDGNIERFFDAEDVDVNQVSCVQTSDNLTPVNRFLSRFRAAFSGSPGPDSFFMQTLLHEVNEIQISCDALKGHLEKLNTKMLKMEDDLASMSVALEKQHLSLSSRRQLTLLSVGFATGLGLGFILSRMRMQA